MTTITLQELIEHAGQIENKEQTRIAGKYEENYIYSRRQHAMAKKLAKIVLRLKLEEGKNKIHY